METITKIENEYSIHTIKLLTTEIEEHAVALGYSPLANKNNPLVLPNLPQNIDETKKVHEMLTQNGVGRLKDNGLPLLGHTRFEIGTPQDKTIVFMSDNLGTKTHLYERVQTNDGEEKHTMWKITLDKSKPPMIQVIDGEGNPSLTNKEDLRELGDNLKINLFVLRKEVKSQ